MLNRKQTWHVNGKRNVNSVIDHRVYYLLMYLDRMLCTSVGILCNLQLATGKPYRDTELAKIACEEIDIMIMRYFFYCYRWINTNAFAGVTNECIILICLFVVQ